MTDGGPRDPLLADLEQHVSVKAQLGDVEYKISGISRPIDSYKLAYIILKIPSVSYQKLKVKALDRDGWRVLHEFLLL